LSGGVLSGWFLHFDFTLKLAPSTIDSEGHVVDRSPRAFFEMDFFPRRERTAELPLT